MATDEWVVRWPTLGFLGADWIEQHCIVPDGILRGAPFELYPWQLWSTVNHYRVKLNAKPAFTTIAGGRRVAPAAAFHNRRSVIVGPQKYGKSPWSAGVIGLEAVGPAVFVGFAGKDDGYACSEWGCGCGWEYPYELGEPMGRPWPSALIQILATSEDQVDNVYRPLQAMAREGPLGERMRVGEDFIRLPNDGRIDPVTSSANSRLGNPITFALQDETGLYTRQNRLRKTAETMRRGLAGMGGRSIGTTNAIDPTDESDAQAAMESQRPDIFVFHRVPPANLSYGNKRERRKIHAFVYQGADHIDLSTIEAEAAELLEKDPAQAERFYGNRNVSGGGKAYDLTRWRELAKVDADGRATHVVPDGALVVVGVDGARFDDAISLIGTEVETGFQWKIHIQEAPKPTPIDYEHDLAAADGALRDVFDSYSVWRVYVDPQKIGNLLAQWQGRWGEDVVMPWWTNRPKQMGYAVRDHVTAVRAGDLSHDGDPDFTRHIGNSVKDATNAKDEDGRTLWVLGKDSDNSPRKIDSGPASVLAWRARNEAIAAGATASPETAYAYGF